MRDEKVFGPVVPEMPPECPMKDRGFFIYRLKVKNLYKFLIGSTTYWKIQYFFVFGIVSQFGR